MYWHYKEKNYDYNVSERFYREQDYEKKNESTNIWPIITKILFDFLYLITNEHLIVGSMILFLTKSVLL